MIELKVGDGEMNKKRWIFLIICCIVCVWLVKTHQKPKIISSVTTFDTTYLTILVDRFETKDAKQLEEKLLKMCMEDTFENMKLQTEDKQLSEKLNIVVYYSHRELEKGVPYLTIKKDAWN